MDVQLVIERGSSKRQVIRLRSEETIVGRRQGSDLRIPSEQVSRRHCRLSFRDGILIVEDLASSNGTFLNGERVSSQEVVRPGDRLDIGPVTLRAKYQLSQAAIDRLLRDETPALEPVVAADDAAEVPEILEDLAEGVTVDEEAEPVLEIVEEGTPVPPADGEEAATAEVIEEEPAAAADPETAQAVNEIFDDDNRPWQPPTGDIRDILSKLDDSK
jgi:predicted component of type VI protein secretion system